MIDNTKVNGANNSLPTFMVSYLQNQHKVQNKLFPENSPERKSHDMMLTSPYKKSKYKTIDVSQHRKQSKKANQRYGGE
jgi:hypothetical protein